MNQTKEYQKIRDSCSYCKDKLKEGLVCSYRPFEYKCSLQTCPMLNNPPLFLMENKKDIKEGVHDTTIDTIPLYKRAYLKEDIRTHAFIWKLNLPKGLKDWDKREMHLIRNKQKFKKNRNGFQEIIYKGYKVWLCNNKIVIYFKKGQSYYAKTPQEAIQSATTDFLCLADSLSRFFKVSFRKGKEYDFKLCRKHHALIKNEVAKIVQEKQQRLDIYDSEGNQRILTDRSLNTNELEAVYTPKNDSDITAIKNFIGSLIEAPFTAYDFATIYKVQEAYAEQIKKHLIVQEETLKTLKTIQEALKK